MEAQQEHYQYQYQTQIDATSVTAYDPSQVQPYDQQSTQAYYSNYQPQQQQDYSSYYYYPQHQDYSNYQTQQPQNDPNSIHPPGVPIQGDAHLQNPQILYNPSPSGALTHYPSASQGYLPPANTVYRGGRSGSGRGAFGRHGRGRGRGRGKHVPPRTHTETSSSVQTNAAPGKPPPQMAWCELCRVDCNTLEILEQHKNGKKHKRNLKVFEELQNLSSQVTAQNPQTPLPLSNPESIPAENKAESASVNVESKTEPSAALPSEESGKRDNFSARGGLKRKTMRGGRGGKWMRHSEGQRRPVEPPKPKQVVPLICDLCNVKCESQVVFESHVAGKKHLSNVKRFEGHKEKFGEGVQALYPVLPHPPSTSITPQDNPQGPKDAEALAAMMLSQYNLPDPQAAQAALAQLLNQHGIHDAQTLLTQLVPHLLAQFQVSGSLSVSAAGLGINTQNSQGPNAPLSTTNVSQNLAENNFGQPNVAAGVGVNEKSDDGQSLHNQVQGEPQDTGVMSDKEKATDASEPPNSSN